MAAVAVAAEVAVVAVALHSPLLHEYEVAHQP